MFVSVGLPFQLKNIFVKFHESYVLEENQHILFLRSCHFVETICLEVRVMRIFNKLKWCLRDTRMSFIPVDTHSSFHIYIEVLILE